MIKHLPDSPDKYILSDDGSWCVSFWISVLSLITKIVVFSW